MLQGEEEAFHQLGVVEVEWIFTIESLEEIPVHQSLIGCWSRFTVHTITREVFQKSLDLQLLAWIRA